MSRKDQEQDGGDVGYIAQQDDISSESNRDGGNDMNGFACSCGWIGTEPDMRQTTEPVEFWGENVRLHGVIMSCPDCDNDELLDVPLCIDCAENGADVLATHDDYCKECAAARKLETDRAALIAALADVLLHVGGHRETDFVQSLPLTWSAAVREAKRVLREVQS